MTLFSAFIGSCFWGRRLGLLIRWAWGFRLEPGSRLHMLAGVYKRVIFRALKYLLHL